MNWKEFEALARARMSDYHGMPLVERQPAGFPKKFDMVSERDEVLGDAKFLTLIGRKRKPPAKFMEIAGHVWLLEQLNARHRFLVFRNQREVSVWWLEKYGRLVRGVSFFFLWPDGTTLEPLPASTTKRGPNRDRMRSIWGRSLSRPDRSLKYVAKACKNLSRPMPIFRARATERVTHRPTQPDLPEAALAT